jgi:transcription antitermination factor NusG
MAGQLANRQAWVKRSRTQGRSCPGGVYEGAVELSQWFAIKSKPRHEFHAAAELTRRGIDTFLPQTMPRRGPARRRAWEPLFPGYLFARLTLGTSQWISARSAPGVAYFLGPKGAPSPVPDELVEMIRVRIAAQTETGWEPPFKHKERVTIDRGPLAGMSAVFEGALTPAGRVRVLLETMNRLVPVDLDISLVGKAG